MNDLPEIEQNMEQQNTIDVLPLCRADIFIKSDVGSVEQREDLKKQILHAKENNIEVMGGGNKGCWRSTAKYKMDWLYDAVKELSDQANKVYFETDPVFKKQVTSCTNRDFGIWTNINDVGSKNVLHTHVEDIWAGIYYVQAEGTGNLVFLNPANTLMTCNQKAPFVRNSVIVPQDGMLVLWPGWMPHEVEENKSNQQRINLAWGVNYN